MTVMRNNIPLIELLILRDYGLLAFHYRVDAKASAASSIPMKSDLFAGFISAITYLARETTGKDLSSLQFKDRTFYQVKKHGLIACAVIANDDHDESEIRCLIEHIMDTYATIFQEDETLGCIIEHDAFKEEQFRSYLLKILNVTDEEQGTDHFSQAAGQHHEAISALLRDVERGILTHEEASQRIKNLFSGFQSLSDREKLDILNTLDELEHIITKSDLPKGTKRRLKKIKNAISLKLRVKKWLDNF